MKPRDRLIQRWMKGEVRVVGTDPRVTTFGPKHNPFRLVHLSDGSRLFIPAPKP